MDPATQLDFPISHSDVPSCRRRSSVKGRPHDLRPRSQPFAPTHLIEKLAFPNFGTQENDSLIQASLFIIGKFLGKQMAWYPKLDGFTKNWALEFKPFSQELQPQIILLQSRHSAIQHSVASSGSHRTSTEVQFYTAKLDMELLPSASENCPLGIMVQGAPMASQFPHFLNPNSLAFSNQGMGQQWSLKTSGPPGCPAPTIADGDHMRSQIKGA